MLHLGQQDRVVQDVDDAVAFGPTFTLTRVILGDVVAHLISQVKQDLDNGPGTATEKFSHIDGRVHTRRKWL